MLESVIGKLAGNERPLITVEECRPFVLAWNGAIESFGAPVGIEANSIHVSETEGKSARCIRDIRTLAKQMCAEQRLL